MRFSSLSIVRFGAMADRELPDLPPGAVVVLGRNESGKSTLFAFLETILYGFSPAGRDQHPYTSWTEARIERSAGLVLDSGLELTVHRRLLSQPQGRVLHGEQSEEIRNQPVPAVQYLPRSLFRSVYALTMRELRFFDEASWERVQDGLLGSLGADFLYPVGKVTGELREEAGRLWRPDRMGKPRSRRIAERLKALARERREAAVRDERIREMSRRLSEVERTADALRESSLRLRGRLHRAERLQPVRARLRQIAELEAKAGDDSAISGLPDAPTERLEGLRAQRLDLDERQLALEERVRALTVEAGSLIEADRQLLERKGEIAGALREVARIRADEERLEEIERLIESQRGRIGERAADLIAEPWSTKFADPVRSVSRAVLGAHIEKFHDVQVRCRAAKERLNAFAGDVAPAPREVTLTALTAVLLTSGLALLAAGIVLNEQIYLVVGTVAALMGAAGLSSWIATRRDRSRQQEKHDRKVNQSIEILHEAEEETRLAAGQVSMLLEALPIVPARLERPHADLVQDVAALQEILTRIEELEGQRDALADRSARRRDEIARTCEAVAVEAEGDMEVVAAALARRLDEARERSRRAGAAGEAIEALDPELAALNARKEALDSEIGELETALTRIGDGDLAAGIAALDARRRAAGLAEEIRDDLARKHPDLETLREEIARAESARESWIVSDEEIVEARDEEARAAEEMTTLRTEAVRLTSEIDHLCAEPTLDRLDSERDALEEELRTVWEERDRLEILAKVLRRADQQFREAHQPDVLKRAGLYLSRITDGRYRRLTCEQGPEGPRLEVIMKDEAFPRSVAHPLSRGTLDQIYLALRLALADHLDDGREHLPLFLDEVLSRWDEKRLAAAADLIRELAPNRQIFLFTCRPRLAERLAGVLDTSVLELPAV